MTKARRSASHQSDSQQSASQHSARASPASDQPSLLETRTARLFKNGSNLAVRIPVDWNFTAHEVALSYDGRSITITPVETDDDLAELFADFAAEPLSEAEIQSWQDPADPTAEPVIV